MGFAILMVAVLKRILLQHMKCLRKQPMEVVCWESGMLVNVV